MNTLMISQRHLTLMIGQPQFGGKLSLISPTATSRLRLKNKALLLMSLTKDDIIKALAKENGFPLNQAVDQVETLIEIIKFSLASGGDVLVSGFGKFCVKEKHQRKGRNPATGESMILEARRVVTFRCSRQLRDKING